MNDYFKHQKIHWKHFTPNDIYFKNNILVKKANANNEINVISYNSKGAFMEEYSKGVFVHVKDIKSEFPYAHINLYDATRVPHCRYGSQNNLAYIVSAHNTYEWKKDPANHYGWSQVKTNKVPLPDEEGYRIELGGTLVGGTPMEMQEQIDIIYAIHKFLIDRVLPAKRGQVQEKALTLVA